MSSERQPMTLEGKAKLEEELKNLVQVERPDVIKAIEEARSHGDLSENAEYDAAKERQALLEARISEIQAKLASAEVVDTSQLQSEKVIFGAHVVLQDLDSEEEITYQIVGEEESDVKNGKISIYSPIARSLIGKKVGDEVQLHTPKGERELEVLDLYFK